MDYGYLADMAKTAYLLDAMRKVTAIRILSKITVKASGDGCPFELKPKDLSSVCVAAIEQALVEEAERYAQRIADYVKGDPDANALYED